MESDPIYKERVLEGRRRSEQNRKAKLASNPDYAAKVKKKNQESYYKKKQLVKFDGIVNEGNFTEEEKSFVRSNRDLTRLELSHVLNRTLNNIYAALKELEIEDLAISRGVEYNPDSKRYECYSKEEMDELALLSNTELKEYCLKYNRSWLSVKNAQYKAKKTRRIA